MLKTLDYSPQYRHYPTPIDKCVGSFKYLGRLNVPVRGRCGERRSPKVQPSTRPGIETGSII